MESAVGVRNAKPRQDSGPTREGHVATHFNTECSVCGRRLLVPIDHLGRLLACGHCGCRFIAADPASHAELSPSLPERADQQLAHRRLTPSTR